MVLIRRYSPFLLNTVCFKDPFIFFPVTHKLTLKTQISAVNDSELCVVVHYNGIEFAFLFLSLYLSLPMAKIKKKPCDVFGLVNIYSNLLFIIKGI